MSDDVKVKFGGDFSDVSSGATDAVSKAGGALNSWWNDFTKSTAASITSALALSAIFGKLTESAMNVMKYSRGIDDAFKRFGEGKSAEEFQLVARYGAEVGVSMEAVGRTMNYFAKATEAATKGTGNHRNALLALKFTDEEIKRGNISAIEVLRRMADEYDRTGLEALSAQRAVQLFGTQGEQLSAIYKNGKINIDEFTKSVKAMDKASLEAAANADRQIERAKRKAADIFATVLQINDFLNPGPYKYDERTGKVMSERQLRIRSEKEAAEAAKNNPKEGPPLLTMTRVMATSSLQTIGGGDVGSIMSGTYQTSMLDAATKTADNTKKLVDNQENRPLPKPASVAK